MSRMLTPVIVLPFKSLTELISKLSDLNSRTSNNQIACYSANCHDDYDLVMMIPPYLNKKNPVRIETGVKSGRAVRSPVQNIQLL
jgi:hypothetical protein